MWIKILKIFVTGVLIALGGGCASTGMRSVDAGPVVSADRDVHGNPRVRVLGPLVETQTRDDGMKFVAVRPFYSKTDDPARERSVSDFLWPIGMMKNLKGELDWRFFPSLGLDYDSDDTKSRHRWSLFPLLYGGQGVTGDKYFAFFPFGGTLRDFLGWDKISFFLFPLYSCCEQDDNKTHTILWPFFSVTRGNDIYRWRIFPFYGVSKNHGRWTKRFVMWPFWTSVKYHWDRGGSQRSGGVSRRSEAGGRGLEVGGLESGAVSQESGKEKNTGGGFILWPLFGKVDFGDSYSRSVFPPFFKWEVGKDGHRALFCPWPIVRYKRGKVNQFYVWPLFGKKAIAGDKRWFVLWPIGNWRRVERPEYTLRRGSVIPVFSYESKTAKRSMVSGEPGTWSRANRGRMIAEGEVFARFFKFWPLFSYQRENDVLRFRALALWPIKNAPAIDRNWAPLWSLYAHERDGGRRETELLWGLYRHQRDEHHRRVSLFPLVQYSSSAETADAESGRSWSFLYGLAGYKRNGLQKQFKMLYFLKFGKLDKD